MSVEQQQQLLASVDSLNPEANSAAEEVNQLTEAVKSGQLSRAEYIELVKDIQHRINIHQDMSELETLEKINTAINGLINLASMV
jgi:hypothetical protein|tara:strand:- start:453 stop:707 length:255 start_codon:yes stop_codon:yes gene_type:complete